MKELLEQVADLPWWWWPAAAYLLWFLSSVLYLIARLLRSAAGAGRRCELTDAEDASESDAFVPKKGASADLLVTLVHGTWGRDSGWHQPGSSFRRRLAEELGRRRVRRLRFRHLHWSGSNSVHERERAARFLEEKVRADRHTSTEVVIAHSHGANVVLRAMLRGGNGRRAGASRFAGLACLGAPFLVGSPRERRRVAALVVALGPVLAALPLALYAHQEAWVSSPSFWVAGALLLLCFVVAALKIGLGLNRYLLPGAGLPGAVGRKLFVLRACGDEASGALSVSYMATWVVNKVAAWLALSWVGKAGGVSTTRRPGRVLQSLARFFLKTLMIVLAFVSVLWLVAWVTAEGVRDTGIQELARNGLLTALGVTFLWVGLYLAVKIFKAGLTLGLELLGQVAVGTLLLPFGPELILASPFVLVTCETVPPVENGDRLAAVVQLGLGEGGRAGIQHAVYNHPRTPEYLAEWIEKDCLPAANAIARRSTAAGRRRRRTPEPAQPSSRSRASGGGSLQTS